MSSTIYIKNMVCVRCKMAVQAVLEEQSIAWQVIELGWTKLEQPLSDSGREKVQEGLKKYELEIMEGKPSILVERVKTEIITLLQASQPLNVKLSVFLSKTLEYNYNYIANTFSEVEGITLERYFIVQRVERVKELIVYEQLPLIQIAEDLGFSSVSHLHQQFKKVAGITPSEFRKLCREENFIWKAL